MVNTVCFCICLFSYMVYIHIRERVCCWGGSYLLVSTTPKGKANFTSGNNIIPCAYVTCFIHIQSGTHSGRTELYISIPAFF